MNSIVSLTEPADDFGEYLAIANEELSKYRWGKKKLTIEVVRSSLHLRGTLPPRDQTAIIPRQSRIALDLPAKTENLQKAINAGKEVARSLNLETFSWDKYQYRKTVAYKHGPDVPGWDEDHFWKASLIKTPEECWLWLKGKDRAGYGQSRRDGRRWMAHRLAYKISYKNFIDDSKLPVCHRCDNPSCVNPYHLFQGTLSENQLDSSLNASPQKTLTTKDLEIMLRLKENGVKVHQIAKAWEISPNQVSKQLSKFTKN
ncbi:hypothetical protein Lepto7375DRAFT_7318 [Leptolyngbya sp. PCC 7375]|nr:hypothetical protein Lepto7375DRAFT_7318 [Leptolyngbya sp. PCC 7375]